jgi:capsular exopolysaccharide synthesis family protein
MRDTLPAHASQPNRGSGEQATDSILEIIWRQRVVVGISVAICLFLALGYLLLATRYYAGSAGLYVQQVGPQVLPGESRQPLQESEAFLYTQKEIVSSTPVIAMALGTPGIRDMKTFSGEDNAFTFFKKSLTVDVGKKNELITVQFETPYKDEAAKIVEALVKSYKEYQSSQRNSSASEVLALLQAEREKLQKELTSKQDELQAFRQVHGMLSSGDSNKSNVSMQRLESLSKALTDAQLETIAAKSAWDDIQRTILSTPARKAQFEQWKSNGLIPGSSAVDDATLRAQMLQQEANLQVLSQRYLPNHPSIRNTQAYIDRLNMQYATAVWRRYDTAQAKEDELQKSYDKQQQVAVAQNKQAVEESRLASDVARLQKLSDERDNQLKNVTVTNTGGAPNIQVLEPPTVLKNATRPRVIPTLVLAILAGGIIGCGVACVRDWYDFRLRSADEIKSALGVTVLGLIPHVEDETSPIARGQKIHIDPASEAAEAYRSLRTAIYFGTKEGQARTILVTSPERGDGKTTCTSNLAISIAQASRRVLLIDADMRAPMQDLIFSMNGRIGLGNVLQGKDDLETAIRHTGIENLDLLPAGVAGRNPSELLNSQRFLDLLDELSEKYDHIVIDSPPLLAVTDARIIAASADATVLVLRAGKSNRKLSELSIDGLMSVGAKMLGAVVNDVRRGRDYRYYGSYGRYGYGENATSDRSREGEMVLGGRDEDAASGTGGNLPTRRAV